MKNKSNYISTCFCLEKILQGLKIFNYSPTFFLVSSSAVAVPKTCKMSPLRR